MSLNLESAVSLVERMKAGEFSSEELVRDCLNQIEATEETVKALEAGGVTLEDATRLFEEGMHLARICHQHLSATELKITHLQRSFGEQMTLTDQDEPDAQD